MKLLQFALLIAFTISLHADETILAGHPKLMYHTSIDKSTRLELDKIQSMKNAVLIVERGGEYFWVSRNNRQLVEIPSGLFTIYIDPLGGGYVKIAELPEGGIVFIEHATLGMETYTYYGVVAASE